MKYFIKLNEMNQIIEVQPSNSMLEGYIELSCEQFHKSMNFTKYNPSTGEFFGEVNIEPTQPTHKEISVQTRDIVEVSSTDNVINMDMLITIDDKLNKIIKHLGI